MLPASCVSRTAKAPKDDDFIGVQNYSRKLVDPEGVLEPARNAPLTQMGYEDYPQAIGNVPRKVARSFPGELFMTENGIATANDSRRCAFLQEAIDSVLTARADGVDVRGYFYWSLLDNLEWRQDILKPSV